MTYNPGVEMELSDMPAWVKAEVASIVGHKRNLVCRIHPVEEYADVGHTWHDNARQTIIARKADGEIKRLQGTYYDTLINADAETAAAYHGGKIALPVEGGQVLRVVVFYKLNNVDLYIRRDGPDMRLLSGLSDGTRLTDIQIAVLHLYTHLTSTGRKMEIGRQHIPQSLVNVVTRELDSMGYLKVAKNGAVRKTIEGKRMSDQTRGKGVSWSEWLKLRNWRTRQFSGFAGEIIDQYRDRMRADMKVRGVI